MVFGEDFRGGNLKITMLKTNKTKIIFFGSDSFSVPILEALTGNYEVVLVVTKNDKIAGRGLQKAANPLKRYAQDKKLPLKIVEKLDDNTVKEIAEIEANLYIVAAFGLLVPESLLESPKGLKTLNVHPSLLPKYRGAIPIEAAILNGDEKTGTTIMILDKELDKGPIVAQEIIEVSSEDDFVSLSEKLQALSAKLLIKMLPDYVTGKTKPKTQDESNASYYKELKKEDGKLDFTKTTNELSQQIRAYSHWPGSFAIWKKKNKQIKIINANMSKELPSPPYAAGMVFKTPEGKPAVVCGKGAIQINILQLEGKKPTDSRDFLNGYPNFIGSNLT